MPASNKRGPFKNRSTKNLAEIHNLPPEVFKNENRFITMDDVQWVIDNINYDLHGIALFNKNNVPPEKRYDTDWLAYTKSDFIFYYGNDYKIHWENGIIYKPIEYIEDEY